VAACRACVLCESRRQTVFGVGHAQAHFMVVGEAPGEQEDQRGEPFVGAAGRLLDQMLAALGLTRAESDASRQVFIANTLKCRPPHNRNPEPGELAACRPFLERQVELVQPRVILAMGALRCNRCCKATSRSAACAAGASLARPAAGGDLPPGVTCCATRPTRHAPGPTCVWRHNCCRRLSHGIAAPPVAELELSPDGQVADAAFESLTGPGQDALRSTGWFCVLPPDRRAALFTCCRAQSTSS